ncbi:response regulator transcription factor [Aestuariicella hydrocarbonica]|uniref:Response regulator transcription factor n=1 Tax=Pseudomaricurvus hydrocarbonicus TaxID=1470433 RepID=A0A9E5JTI7_9GAMM|nr:response regulator transcription factor [Aestuariicella hydrocarbonica]NHO66567.1 response regulator transcription factor [Aestuariicella hydrocarbonica]
MTYSDKQDIVLVVDDSPDSLSLISDVLEEANISVLVALEGRQALTIAQRLRPDMILLDAIMPKMDGFETCRQLKADPELASIPVIFMTGLTETENIVQGLEAGGVDYLTKPIKPNELLARMKVHLNNARLTTSAQQALDSTGQFLMTTDHNGQLLWATPQVRELFHKAPLPTDELQQSLASELKFWLQHAPSPQQKLKLEKLGLSLSVVFIEQRNPQEFLLKLVDDVEVSDQELFQKKLSLTVREAEVLHWIACGKTNREIGEILAISPRTVNKHLEQVFQKIGVENRTAAASVALRIANESLA